MKIKCCENTSCVCTNIIHQMSKFLKPYVDWLLSNKKTFQILFFCMVTVNIFFISTAMKLRVYPRKFRLYFQKLRVFFSQKFRVHVTARKM